MLTSNEVDGAMLLKQWNDSLATYKAFVEKYKIDLSGKS